MVRIAKLSSLKKRTHSSLAKRLNGLERELKNTLDTMVSKGRKKIGYTRTKEYKNLMNKQTAIRKEIGKTTQALSIAWDRELKRDIKRARKRHNPCPKKR